MNTIYPLPDNEWQRVLELADYDLDFSALQDKFKDLTKLAAKVTGTDISLVNLIDSYTQWSIASHGLDLVSMPREESVCQYTILQPDSLEVKDLQLDQRFAQRWYVADAPHLRYYFGIPLKSSQGTHLGALCVLDPHSRELDPEKIELLHIIASEVVSRLNTLREVEYLKRQATELTESKKRVAHDIRGPLGGIISMAQLVTSSGSAIQLNEILELIEVMQHSSKSLLELANEILLNDDKWHHRQPDLVNQELFHQARLKEMLEKLYAPQARAKGIAFSVSPDATTELVPFSRSKVLQIAGNLISNAIKFTPQQGYVRVSTKLVDEGAYNLLSLVVEDSGKGMPPEKVTAILKGEGTSSHGTAGESGYGFGLPLVKHLVETLNGQIIVRSTPGQGSCFEVSLRQPKWR
ncbi:GAF domain-containing sensor histidine kinase [Spirosoma sp. KNUC1025]|uniref:GAF domain-containing sensor histidine kinase n=1 Tax=Spirosoma sp. KNUC1025 TaxID=2894082 RepID=UPI001E4F700C|nr:GAF domain-containing sensor histidine kinase [Spirosoma sp. KNUC1025]UFH57783.1 GAF domain-containing sensor histidine kinase [Spirosoma sp. KNUC1025]